MDKMRFTIRTAPNRRRDAGLLSLALVLVLIVLASALMTPRAAQAAEPTQVPLTVAQVLSSDGSAAAPKAMFTYRMTAQDPTTPLPQGSNGNSYDFTVTGNATITLDPINFTEPGIYSYELRCLPTAEAGFATDTQVYTIKMYVTSDLQMLSIVYLSNGEKAIDPRFTQRYSARASDPMAMVDPPVQKTVVGNPPQKSTFTFRLKAEDASDPMPQGSAQGAKTLQILGAGQGEFGGWSYVREGTYRYTVAEVNTGIKCYTYDVVVYTITDTVKAVNGQLVVSRVVTDGAGKRLDACKFTNYYSTSIINSILPKTGDMLRLAPYVGLTALAFAAVGAFLFLDRRTKGTRA